MGKNKEQYTDNCDNCGNEVPINKETAYIVNFTRCFGNFVLNACVECGQKTRLFVDDKSQEAFQKHGLKTVNTELIPPPDFVEAYLKVNGIPLPEEHELTPRQDERIANIGKFLQSIDLDLSDFER